MKWIIIDCTFCIWFGSLKEFIFNNANYLLTMTIWSILLFIFTIYSFWLFNYFPFSIRYSINNIFHLHSIKNSIGLNGECNSIISVTFSPFFTLTHMNVCFLGLSIPKNSDNTLIGHYYQIIILLNVNLVQMYVGFHGIIIPRNSAIISLGSYLLFY